ncbi:MAG: membrane protein insertase YidC [Alphaproteobacteria bacterium]|jgi:YidC/Oxa1 family membrane protein insertase|nr:membrane protein insertase YidC [Alphaproteobacteria bacterium]
MNYSFLNLVTAIVVSVLIIFGWQHFYEKPKLQRLAQEQKHYNKTLENVKKETQLAKSDKVINRHEALNSSKRIPIKSAVLSGSISLQGLRFDDLTLLKYHTSLDENSPPVVLFSPSAAPDAYFAEIGWLGNNKNTKLPDSSTVWEADGDIISPGKPITFIWTNAEKIKFVVKVELDDNYMFTIKQTTINNSSHPLQTQYYALINRTYVHESERMVNILHQGMIGAVNGELKEYNYDDIKDKKKQSFTKNKVDWLGITDKYWLAAFIPDSSYHYSSNFIYGIKSGMDKYQADLISTAQIIESGGSFELTHKLFAGAKKVDLLDKYENQYNIKLFDRAIDFGWFYILTKPIFNAMNFFYLYVGNFGISIMIVTIIIKLAMFTLANKSYRSMKKMKNLQPQMERLKELYADDKARLNQEIMNLYKKEKVNPVSGCLPLLIQIPVFFSIYKVLYVTIEMRHAPFFGWIHDLSAPDPTTIFNLFGLLPFTPPAFLMIGAWPIIMAITMYLQQKMSPQPADPVQAMVMKFMPLMFLFMFSSFPAGLLIYWSWNNILSIVQQFYINKLDKNGQ